MDVCIEREVVRCRVLTTESFLNRCTVCMCVCGKSAKCYHCVAELRCCEIKGDSTQTREHSMICWLDQDFDFESQDMLCGMDAWISVRCSVFRARWSGDLISLDFRVTFAVLWLSLCCEFCCVVIVRRTRDVSCWTGLHEWVCGSATVVSAAIVSVCADWYCTGTGIAPALVLHRCCFVVICGLQMTTHHFYD